MAKVDLDNKTIRVLMCRRGKNVGHPLAVGEYMATRGSQIDRKDEFFGLTEKERKDLRFSNNYSFTVTPLR